MTESTPADDSSPDEPELGAPPEPTDDSDPDPKTVRRVFNTLLEQTTEPGEDWTSRRALLTVAAAHSSYSGETVLDTLEYLVDEGYVEQQWDDRDPPTQQDDKQDNEQDDDPDPDRYRPAAGTRRIPHPGRTNL